MHNIRRPYDEPSHPDSNASIPVQAKLVTFRHPGYADSKNLFLLLPALDAGGTIHHKTALTACYILSGNRRDGFLAEDKMGSKKVDESIIFLDKQDYYFYIPNLPEYEIVPTFDDWEFPHRDLPTIWQQCETLLSLRRDIPRSTSNAVLNRDGSCRISLHREGTQTAHLIPVSYAAWFDWNGMSMYAVEGTDIGLVSNQGNAILLRSDLHTIFDTKRFTFVPKEAPELSEKNPVLVTHVLDRHPLSEVVQLYHNVQLQPLSGIAVEFLYARFALTVFELFKASSFLSRGIPRILRVRNTDDYTTKRFSAPQCQAMARRFQSRSVSPKKRKPDEPEVEERDPVDGNVEDEYPEEESRGRKRRRTSSIDAGGFPTPVSSCSFHLH